MRVDGGWKLVVGWVAGWPQWPQQPETEPHERV